VPSFSTSSRASPWRGKSSASSLPPETSELSSKEPSADVLPRYLVSDRGPQFVAGSSPSMASRSRYLTPIRSPRHYRLHRPHREVLGLKTLSASLSLLLSTHSATRRRSCLLRRDQTPSRSRRTDAR
jgi:hypothetical protein